MPIGKGFPFHKMLIAISAGLVPAPMVYERIPHQQLPTPPPQVIAPQEEPFTETYYLSSVNDAQDTEPILVLLDKKNNVWVNVKDIERWKIQLPAKKAVSWNDASYINLNELPGAHISTNTQNMSMSVQLPPAYFTKHIYNLGSSQLTHIDRPDPGLFINYTLNDTHIQGVDTLSSLVQFNAFGKYGAGYSQYVLSNTSDKKILRYKTSWYYDQPEKMTSWRFGDLTTYPGAWSGSVNFAGIQWASNFETQPQYLTYPLPGVSGAAVVPTILDLYVNNLKTQEINLTPGSYSVSNIPVVSGQGNLQIVTTDILGNQQVISGNYFLNTTILNAGLHRFSYEFGIVRQNLGLANYDYSNLVLSATDQYSPNNKTAIEWHGEVLPYEQAAGIGVTRLFPSTNITLNSSAAMSNNSALGAKKGGQFSLGIQKQALGYNYGATTTIASPYFTDMGMTSGTMVPKLTLQIFGGVQFLDNSLAFNYTKLLNRSTQSSEIFTTTLTREIAFDISMTLTWLDVIRGSATGKSIFLSLSKSLDNSTSASYSGVSQPGTSYQNSWQLQRSLPVGTGYGYSLLEQRSTSEMRQASLSYQNDYGTWLAQYTQTPGASPEQYYFSAQGAVVFFGGKGFLSRQINNSFGVVKVDGFDNVGIYSYNQLVGTTDKEGYLIIPNLISYVPTPIAIDAGTIPLNTEITQDRNSITAFSGSGVIVHFAAKTIRSATLTVKQPDGKPIPEGVNVTIDGTKETYVSGLDGAIYLTNLTNQNTIHILWDQHDCVVTFTVPPPDKDNPVPDLGVYTCKDIGETHRDKQ